MNGAHWLVRTLQQRGVEYVFVLCGNGLNPFLEACMDEGLPVIDVRNEQAAAYMADLWGRYTRRLGVAAVSSGPGHTNALTGLANAHWDGGPMLLISGCSDLRTRGLGHFQELNQVEMAAPVCKVARYVTHIDALEHEVDNAIAAAVASRPGPVHLTIPVNVLTAEMEETALQRRPQVAEVNPRAWGDPDRVREAVAELARAERPFMVVGSGAFYARAGEALRRFAELTNIPILSHLWDRGCIEGPWPQYVGVTSGEVNGAFPLLAEADVILTLGARVDFRLGYGRPPAVSATARFIRVDADPAEVHQVRPADLGIVGDPRSVLEQMFQAGADLRWAHQDWLERVRAARAAFLARWDGRGRERVCPVPALRICREIQKIVHHQDVTFLLDGGNIGRWAHLLLWDRHPEHWLTCGLSGVIGWGLPGAVAMNLARPGKPVLLLSGDGSAGFTLAEIETARRFHTPYVAVVAHDAAWGIVADAFPEGRRTGTLLGELRFDRVAEALGGRGLYIDDPDQLGPAIAGSLQQDTVTFIHVPTQLGGIDAWDRIYGRGAGPEGCSPPGGEEGGAAKVGRSRGTVTRREP